MTSRGKLILKMLKNSKNEWENQVSNSEEPRHTSKCNNENPDNFNQPGR